LDLNCESKIIGAVMAKKVIDAVGDVWVVERD